MQPNDTPPVSPEVAELNRLNVEVAELRNSLQVRTRQAAEDVAELREQLDVAIAGRVRARTLVACGAALLLCVALGVWVYADD